MTAYLIRFRPETESPKEGALLPELQRRARESAARKPIVEAWAFHAHQRVAVGDRVFLLLQGAGGPAIFGYGSAAGPLAVHLTRHGRVAFGEEIEIRQGSEIDRASLLHARAEGSPERIERVEVGGAAVIVAGGEFLLGG